jgi:ADP-heptose:LPS heptosyltransferase
MWRCCTSAAAAQTRCGRSISSSRWPAVVFPLGEVELERITAADQKRLAAVGKVVSPANLGALAKLIRPARVYVGNDAGPTHLAAMLGVPTVALFARNNEQTWRPAGPAVSLVRHTPIESLSVERVMSVVEESLKSKPDSPATSGDDEAD